MRALLIIAGLVLATIPAQASNEGWWVVLAAFQNPDGRTFDRASIDRIYHQALRCGVRPFNDHSGKFVGFEPGYDVHVAGAFESRQTAIRVREQVSRCVPDAYIKFGRYLGE